jgi:hypothetical protein
MQMFEIRWRSSLEKEKYDVVKALGRSDCEWRLTATVGPIDFDMVGQEQRNDARLAGDGGEEDGAPAGIYVGLLSFHAFNADRLYSVDICAVVFHSVANGGLVAHSAGF